MRMQTTLPRFARGLVWDAAGVAGGLLQADDVVPLKNGQGWRTRGGKSLPGWDWGLGSGGGVGGGLYTWPPIGSSSYNLYFGNASTGYQFAVMGSGSSAFAALSQTAIDAVGGALTFGGAVSNSFYSTGDGVLVDNEYRLAALDGSTGTQYLPSRWGGNYIAAASLTNAGTVAGTSGSKILTGTGTAFTSSHVGAYIWINDATTTERHFRIVRRISATSIEVDVPMPSTFVTKAYSVRSLGAWTVKPGTFGVKDYGSTITASSVCAAAAIGDHIGRVFGGNVVDVDNVWYPDRLRWSAVVGEVAAGTMWTGADYWHPNAYVDVFPNQGWGIYTGIRAVAAHGSTLFVFKGGAIFALRGFVETDGRDIGASLEVVSWDVGLSGGQVVKTENGLVFASNRGLYLLNESGLTNLCERDGVRSLWQAMFGPASPGGTAGVVQSVSQLEGRLVVQGSITRASAASSGNPNTLVYYQREGVWVTQTTYLCTQVQRWAAYGNVLPVEIGIGRYGETVSTVAGEAVRWDTDHDFTSLVTEGGRAPTMRIQSHAFPLDGKMNGRIRAVMVKAKIVDPSTLDPALQPSLLLGEEGEATAVEAAIVAASMLETGTETEQWQRCPVRAGTPPVSEARVKLAQTAGSADLRVYEVGVEHVGVGRAR